MSGIPGVPVLRLHHLGVLVADLEAAMGFYGGTLGLAADAPHEAPAHDIRGILLDVGESHIELFAPSPTRLATSTRRWPPAAPPGSR